MSERQTQQSDDVSEDVDLSVGVDTEFDEPVEPAGPGEDSGGVLGSLYGRTLGRVLSGRGLAVAFGLTLAFSVLFGLLPFLGLVGNLLGVAIAGFLYGLGSDRSRYVELLVAGAGVGGASALLGNLLVVTLGSLTGLLGVGVLGGALVAVLGHYFGRDLRNGLTREVE